MYTHYSYKFHKDIVTLHPGEYFVSGEDLYIATVLGSCVAVALYDPVHKIGGLNHFLLPGDAFQTDGGEENPRYGTEAMRVLLRELLRAGADRDELRAKVFGGGNVLTARSLVGSGNVAFALSWLKQAGIPVTDRDVEDVVARKLFMAPSTGRVYLKHLEQSLLEEHEVRKEQDLIKIRKKDVYGDFILFEN